jgi:hypothetical protein
MPLSRLLLQTRGCAGHAFNHMIELTHLNRLRTVTMK